MILQPIHELRERNDCHNPKGSPAGGRFCSEPTTIGITSQRPTGEPGHQSNREVFQSMRQFESELRQLRGVSDVSVLPALGAWEGGNEASWAVSYRGNGEATKLLARTGKQFNQDAILMLKGCGSSSAGCQPVVEIEFDRPVSIAAREGVHDVLGNYRRTDGGPIMGGWTWLKRNGKTVLRMVNVPQWGGDAALHVATAAKISRDLQAAGLRHAVKSKAARVSVMERDGDRSYDSILARG